MPFFRWDENLLDVLLHGNLRTSLNVVVSTVLDKMLDGFTRPRKTLHFVKDNDAFAFRQFYVASTFKQHEKGVKVVKIFIETTLDLCRGIGEVDQKITGIFVAGKFLGNVALANTSRSINHQCCTTIAAFLPFQHLLVYLTFHCFCSLYAPLYNNSR